MTPYLEPDHPKNTLVALYLTVSSFFTVVIIIGVYAYFRGYTQDEMYTKIDLSPTDAIMTLRHRETGLLGQDITGLPKANYEVVDAAKGIYRIPIDRAIDLEAQAPWRTTGTPAAGAQAAPAHAHAPATAH